MFKTAKDFDVASKRVLLRCDFNVPLDESGHILDDFRIKKTLPTIEYLIHSGAKVILMSHLGDPKGRIVETLSLARVKDRLMERLGLVIAKTDDCIGSETEKEINQMRPGEIVLLENLRFHGGEEVNDDDFARSLAALGDIYLNDAFGVSHRAHASVVGLPKYLPRGAGFLLELETATLSELTQNPVKPLVVIMGGAKVETKIKSLNRFSKMAEWILLGNLMAREIRDKEIILDNPQKFIEAPDGILYEGRELDIGPGTIKIFKDKISQAKTIFWNGPLGKIEDERFCAGTREIANEIARGKSFSVVGGGETVEFINKMGLADKFGHVSTGGGAMLAYLAGEKLPGLEALRSEG